MNKGMKSEVLKHWFGIDSVLFGKKATDSLSEDQIPNYLSTKGALLSNLFEIYKKIKFDPDTSFETVQAMIKEAFELADSSKKRAKEVLEEDSAIDKVKKEIKEIGTVERLSEKQVARYVINKRRSAVALDSMMLELALTEDQKKLLNDWKGKVLINAHKTLRDNLIEISLQ